MEMSFFVQKNGSLKKNRCLPGLSSISGSSFPGESTSILAPRLCRAALRWFGDHLGTNWGWRKQQGITASVPLTWGRWTDGPVTLVEREVFFLEHICFFNVYIHMIDICICVICVRKYMNYYISSWIMCKCRAFADFVAVDMDRIPGLDVPRSQHGPPIMGNPNIGPRLGYIQLSIEWTFSRNSI